MNTSFPLNVVIEGWASLGFTKAQAVHAIIEGRLSRQNARGHGNRAARREALALMPEEAPLTSEELDEMLNRMNRQYWADRQAELATEGRVRS